MRRARRSTLFRTALATALAAITIPFIAHAAFGEDTAATAMGVITKDVLVLNNALGRQADHRRHRDHLGNHQGRRGTPPVETPGSDHPSAQRFANGTTYDVAAVRTASVGSIGNVCRTFDNQVAGVESGTLTVDEVQYDGDTVTSISASWIVECAASHGSATSQGFVRLTGDRPHPLVAPAPVTMPEAGRVESGRGHGDPDPNACDAAPGHLWCGHRRPGCGRRPVLHRRHQPVCRDQPRAEPVLHGRCQ